MRDLEKKRAANAAWKKANKERVRAYEKVHRKQYYEANKERLKAYTREWIKANPEKAKQRSAAYYREHFEYIQAATHEYYEANKSEKKKYAREWRLKKLYGMTWADYEKMFNDQGGVCKICGEPSVDGRRLAIDHCHETGVVRGLLCSHCNRGLGFYKNDPDLIMKALTYAISAKQVRQHMQREPKHGNMMGEEQ